MAQLSETTQEGFTAADLRRRAAGTLLTQERVAAAFEDARPLRGDFDLNPDLYDPEAATRNDLPAAVLIPIIDRQPEATVLMTLRTEHLPNHAGQIAFPGGKLDPDDAGPAAAALREAREEIGLDPRHVEILGFLDCYLSRTGFRIAPAVAIVSPAYAIKRDPIEVAEVFEVPLRFLMSAENHQTHALEWKGQRRRFHAIPYENRYIWGVTAGIVRNLYQWLYG